MYTPVETGVIHLVLRLRGGMLQASSGREDMAPIRDYRHLGDVTVMVENTRVVVPMFINDTMQKLQQEAMQKYLLRVKNNGM